MSTLVDDGGGPIRIEEILGTWTATDEASSGLARLVLSDREGVFRLEPFAAGREGVSSLGEVPARAYGASPRGGEATAMTARLDLTATQALLTFYLKGGILVLDAFLHAPAGGGHYARELFHRLDAERVADQRSRGVTDARCVADPRYERAHTAAPAAPPVDLRALSGEWHNASTSGPEVSALRVIERDSGWGARLRGAVPYLPADWGETEVIGHATGPGSREAVGWSTVFEFSDMESIVTSYSTRGILVLDCHVRFKDGGRRSDFLVREFFHR